MSRRLWTTLTAFALVLAALPLIAGAGAPEPRPGGTFFDENGTTHEPNIEAIARAGITAGCVPEGTAFCPSQSVTRAQMASFLARALQLEPAPAEFGDVDPSSVHAPSIGAIAQAGITFGCGPGVFCPDDPVVREQMASFLARALDLDPLPMGPFTDVAGTHLANVNAIAAAGITLGCSADGMRFCPEDEVTRAQMASFLARGLGLEPVALPVQIHLVGLDPTCSGDIPVCLATTRAGPADAYYVLEGWLYALPYETAHESILRSDETDVVITLDGTEITGMVDLPITEVDGTVAKLRGATFGALDPGVHQFEATWRWNGQVTYRASVTVDVAG